MMMVWNDNETFIIFQKNIWMRLRFFSLLLLSLAPVCAVVPFSSLIFVTIIQYNEWMGVGFGICERRRTAVKFPRSFSFRLVYTRLFLLLQIIFVVRFVCVFLVCMFSLRFPFEVVFDIGFLIIRQISLHFERWKKATTIDGGQEMDGAAQWSWKCKEIW